MKLPLYRANKLIEKAREEETREAYYKWWLARVPMYDKNNYETFDKFYDKNKPKKIELDSRSKDEIMEDILAIESRQKGKKWYN